MTSGRCTATTSTTLMQAFATNGRANTGSRHAHSLQKASLRTTTYALTIPSGLFLTLWVSFVGLTVGPLCRSDIPHARCGVYDCLHVLLCDVCDLVLYVSPGS